LSGITEEEAQSWASELPIYGDTFRYFVLGNAAVRPQA
jgi:hypothetical protein